jgi:hypothetical protein
MKTTATTAIGEKLAPLMDNEVAGVTSTDVYKRKKNSAKQSPQNAGAVIQAAVDEEHSTFKSKIRGFLLKEREREMPIIAKLQVSILYYVLRMNKMDPIPSPDSISHILCAIISS